MNFDEKRIGLGLHRSIAPEWHTQFRSLPAGARGHSKEKRGAVFGHQGRTPRSHSL